MNRRCDHDPAAPRLRLAAPIAPNLPRFIRDMIDRARRIYTHPHQFPELTGEAFTDARVRMRRSSHREACALTLAAFARRCDRRTLRIGDQRDDGLCTGVPVYDLVEHTGISRHRIKRAIATLTAAGYVNSSQPVVRLTTPRSRPGGGVQVYAGLPAVRVLRPLVLQRLGFKPAKIARARRRGYEDWCRRRGRAVSPVQVLRWHRDVTGLVASNRDREARLGALLEAPPDRIREP